MTDITAIGEILIDLTQTGTNAAGVPLFAANPGGAPANVAVAAAKLGAAAAFIGKAGKDGFGSYLRRVLEENGVSSRGLCTGKRPTTMAVVSVDADGERDFRFIRGADSDLVPEEIHAEAVQKSKVLHFGSVSLTQETSRSAVLKTVEAARQAGVLVSYDPNYRPALWNSGEEAVTWMQKPLSMVDIIKLSEEEVPLLTGSDDLEEGSRCLAQQGIALVLVTLGGRGAFCRWQEETFTVPGVSVKIADTNGAGDTFLGAVLSRLCRRGAQPLQNLDCRELKDIVAFANCAAAATCSRSGAIPAMPMLKELEGGISR